MWGALSTEAGFVVCSHARLAQGGNEALFSSVRTYYQDTAMIGAFVFYLVCPRKVAFIVFDYPTEFFIEWWHVVDSDGELFTARFDTE